MRRGQLPFKEIAMKASTLALGAALMLPVLACAQVKTGSRPREATALCKDGTFYTGNDQAAACRTSGGLQEWWGRNVAPKDSPAAAPTPRTDTRGPYEKAEHPKPVTPPAGNAPAR